jgi:hypothetical protein
VKIDGGWEEEEQDAIELAMVYEDAISTSPDLGRYYCSACTLQHFSCIICTL